MIGEVAFALGLTFGIVLASIFYWLWQYTEGQNKISEDRMVKRLAEELGKLKVK